MLNLLTATSFLWMATQSRLQTLKPASAKKFGRLTPQKVNRPNAGRMLEASLQPGFIIAAMLVHVKEHLYSAIIRFS